MEVSYKRRLSQSYMILKGEESPEELYELSVLAYNRIGGLLAVETEISDGEACFWYDITGKQSLADYLERKPVDSQFLKLLFAALEKVCSQVQEYLLSEEHLVLEPEYLYVDFGVQDVGVVYLPGFQRDLRDSFRELMELLLRKVDHRDRQGAAAAYEMYQLSLQRELSFPDMLQRALEAGKEEPKEQEQCQSGDPDERIRSQPEGAGTSWGGSGLPQEESSWAEPPQGLLAKFKERFARKALPEELPYVVGETEPVTYPTELLCDRKAVRGLLKYLGEGSQPDFSIEKEVFHVGKERGAVDGCIQDKSVSRVHARILREDGEYYLEDLNSTNGTFWNGEELEYRQRVKLAPKDRVGFGRMEFTFL